MSTLSQPLLVPCVIQALRVDNPFLNTVPDDDVFRYSAGIASLQSNHKLSRTLVNFDRSPGVYVHWHLPRALRTGRMPKPTGTATVAPVLDSGIDFPLVPNRWLVVRYATRVHDEKPTVTGWIIESDTITTDLSSPQVFHPTQLNDNGYRSTVRIGKKFLLNKDWTESRNEPLFLTSMGPGLADFSEFQPYNNNVFSLFDGLTDLKLGDQRRLSYLVVGWYSDPSKDVFTPDPKDPARSTAAKLLASLRWTHSAVAGAPTAAEAEAGFTKALHWENSDTPPADRPHALYCGTVLGLDWQLGDPEASVNRILAKDITYALGPTPVEAQMAHLSEVAKLPGDHLTDQERYQFEAFVEGWLPLLAGERAPDAVLEHCRQSTRFTAQSGGHHWEIRYDSSNPPAEEDKAIDKAVLDGLNHQQQAYDTGLRELLDARQRLYGLWWLSRTKENKLTPEQAKHLDPAVPGSVAKMVKDTSESLFGPDGRGGIRAQLPLPTGNQDPAQPLRAYEQAKKLHGILICVPLPSFHVPNPPTLLMHGLQASEPLAGPDPLPCRTPDQIITSLTPKGSTTALTAPSDLLISHLAHIPLHDTTIKDLLGELYILDRATPNGRTSFPEPDQKTGTIPEYTTPWKQPWSPLFLHWEICCRPTPDTAKWKFNTDTAAYQWDTTQKIPDVEQVIQGDTPILPLLQFITKGGADQHNSNGSEQWTKLIGAQDDQISFSLSEINDRLSGRDPGFSLTPNKTPEDDAVRTLLGSAGPYPKIPAPAKAKYHTIRGGQFYFTSLRIIDRFGFSVSIINSGNAGITQISKTPAFTPDVPFWDEADEINPINPKSVVQIPPALSQPARLRFDYTSATDGTHIIDPDTGNPADATPLCGWIIHNRINSTPSLLVYDPQGHALGELRQSDSKPFTFFPASLTGAPATTPDQLRQKHPHLAQFITGLSQDSRITALLDALDTILPTIAPPPDTIRHHPAFLLGRPLALLRASLELQLSGPLLTGTTAPELVKPATPPTQTWPVKLGGADLTTDGLIGYYTEDDYTQLHPVTNTHTNAYLPPNTEQSIIHLKPITTPGTATTHVTLLTDPLAAVHAYTGILPPTTLRLPPRFLNDALATIKPLLPGGTLLTTHHNTTITAPCPTNTTWTWHEPDPQTNNTWNKYTATKPNPTTDLTETTPKARTGYLTIEPKNP
ncbi:hypothetical protein [Streptomyces wuyuanensis]|uniref:hypothetical protein n=1 Tax=Streptomyces wuyuanensis TaxID=1196353 RepID=UPI0034370D86